MNVWKALLANGCPTPCFLASSDTLNCDSSWGANDLPWRCLQKEHLISRFLYCIIPSYFRSSAVSVNIVSRSLAQLSERFEVRVLHGFSHICTQSRFIDYICIPRFWLEVFFDCLSYLGIVWADNLLFVSKVAALYESNKELACTALDQ